MCLDLLCRFALPMYRGLGLLQLTATYNIYVKRDSSAHIDAVKSILTRCFLTYPDLSIDRLTNFDRFPFSNHTYSKTCAKSIEQLVTERFKIVDSKKGEKDVAFAFLFKNHTTQSKGAQPRKQYVIAINPNLDETTRKRLVTTIASRVLDYDGLSRPAKTFTFSTAAALSGIAFGMPLAASFLLTLSVDYIANKVAADKEARIDNNFLVKCSNIK